MNKERVNKLEKITVAGVTERDLQKIVYLISFYRLPKYARLQYFVMKSMHRIGELNIDPGPKLNSFRTKSGFVDKKVRNLLAAKQLGLISPEQNKIKRLQLAFEILKLFTSIDIFLPRRDILKSFIQDNYLKVF